MQSASADVVVVTVTYGDRSALLERIAKPLLTSPALLRWVIVTNGVGAGAERKIAALDPRVILRAFVTNTGSAAAYADGIATALALDQNVDFVWLLDDDNLPDVETLARLLAAHAKITRDAGERWRTAVCALRPAKAPQIARGVTRRAPSSFLGFHGWQWLRNRFPPVRAVAAPLRDFVPLDTAPYGGLLLPRRLLREAGLPDPRFVLYADDTEFTDRIVRGGGRILLVPAARITDVSASWQGHGRALRAWLDQQDVARVYYGARNEAWFDSHRLATQRWLYRVHRGIVLAAWWCMSRRPPRRARFALLREAIREGEAGRLGVDARYPLETSAPDE